MRGMMSERCAKRKKRSTSKVQAGRGKLSANENDKRAGQASGQPKREGQKTAYQMSEKKNSAKKKKRWTCEDLRGGGWGKNGLSLRKAFVIFKSRPDEGHARASLKFWKGTLIGPGTLLGE